jgi:hypothetical protein
VTIAIVVGGDIGTHDNKNWNVGGKFAMFTLNIHKELIKVNLLDSKHTKYHLVGTKWFPFKRIKITNIKH